MSFKIYDRYIWDEEVVEFVGFANGEDRDPIFRIIEPGVGAGQTKSALVVYTQKAFEDSGFRKLINLPSHPLIEEIHAELKVNPEFKKELGKMFPLERLMTLETFNKIGSDDNLLTPKAWLSRRYPSSPKAAVTYE